MWNLQLIIKTIFYNSAILQTDLVEDLIKEEMGDYYVFNKFDEDDEDEDIDNKKVYFWYVINQEHLDLIRNGDGVVIYEYKDNYWFGKTSYGCSLETHLENLQLEEHINNELRRLLN